MSKIESCPLCEGTGRKESSVEKESVEDVRTRVDENLTELAERFGELQSSVERAGKNFEEYVLKVEKIDYKGTDFVEALTVALESNLETVDNEVYSVMEVLHDYEESRLALLDALEDDDG